MIKKEILNQMSEKERKQFLFNLNLLLISVRIYFKYEYVKALEDIDLIGRPVYEKLNKIFS